MLIISNKYLKILEWVLFSIIPGKMDEKDKHILKECLTLEGEDKITKESFKTLFSYLKDTTEVEPIQEED